MIAHDHKFKSFIAEVNESKMLQMFFFVCVFCKVMIICIKIEWQHKQIHWILSNK